MELHLEPNPAILVTSGSGLVLSTNDEAAQWLSAAPGQSCSQVIGAHAGAPCRDGCTRALLESTVTAPPADMNVDGRAMTLTCAPCGEGVVCVLSPSTTDTPRRWEDLTERERQVLEAVAEGETNPLIAERLGISQSTVRAHLEHARDRLGCSTRSQLVARCLRTGLLK